MAQVGDIVAERYELEQVLGEGSMGAVWAARHRLTLKRVALKFLKDVDDPAMVQRFVREAQAASAVRHPNVIQVHDVLDSEQGLALVMDLLEGESLEARLQRGGPLPVGELARLMSRVVSALRAVHAAGVVHRDLKPDNIFLVPHADGRCEPVLLDFGVCKLKRSHTAPESGTPITKTGDLIGTPSYMAPEQISAANSADARVDVWALGVILYECASGLVPFRGRSLPEVVLGILNAPITPLEELVPDLPRPFLDLVERLLVRNPVLRPAELTDAQVTLDGLSQLAPVYSRLALAQTKLQPPDGPQPSADLSGWFRTLSRGRLGSRASAHGRARGLFLFAGAMLCAGMLSTLLLGAARSTPAASMSAAAPSAASVLAPAPSAATEPVAAPAQPSVVAPPPLAKAPARKPKAVVPARGKIPVTNFGGRR